MPKSPILSLDRPHPPVPGMAMPNDHMLDLHRGKGCTPIVHFPAQADCDEILIMTAGWRADVLDLPETLLAADRSQVPSCLVLDISRSRANDLSFCRHLASLHPEIPVIGTAEDLDLGWVVNIVKAGAFDVLCKPVAEAAFLEAVRRALQHSESVLKQDCQLRIIRDRYASLSLRERQIMGLLSAGLLNKQVGGELGISEITVKAHRGRLMRKMQAGSFASLIKMATLLEL